MIHNVFQYYFILKYNTYFISDTEYFSIILYQSTSYIYMIQYISVFFYIRVQHIYYKWYSIFQSYFISDYNICVISDTIYISIILYQSTTYKWYNIYQYYFISEYNIYMTQHILILFYIKCCIPCKVVIFKRFSYIISWILNVFVFNIYYVLSSFLLLPITYPQSVCTPQLLPR